MKLLLRTFQDKDYPALKKLWQDTGLDHPERNDNLDVIRRTLDLGGSLILMFDANNRLVGSSWITLDGRRSWIHHFGIHPDYQGRGWSHLLMKETIKEIKRIGLQVKLEVHQLNSAALHLYESYDFKPLEGYLVYMIR